MKKSTILAAAVFAILIFFSFATELKAQSEFRIKQAIPSDIDSLYITAGWQVHIKQDKEASVTIVTPCEAFFDEDSEPELCKIEGHVLTMLENSSMPKNTVIEIVLSHPVRFLNIAKHATVTTEDLTFSEKPASVKLKIDDVEIHNNYVEIDENAIVSGTVWRTPTSIMVDINPDASLKLDSLTAGKRIYINQSEDASLECDNMISQNTELKRAKHIKGTVYQSDTAKHLTVKTRWYLTREAHGIFINGGITAPIPLYMNNKQGSPYNRGENYRINLQMQFITVKLTNRLSYTSYLRYEWDWRRLLNTVKKEGDALVLDNSFGALNPQQHLLAQNLGLDYNFTYTIGKKNVKTGMPAFRLNFGMAVMYNISGRLATRTMGEDNRWHRTNEKVDVFNPWQLRAHVGIGGGPLTKATLSLTYDLLPTFRSGIGEDKIHSFGVSINF